MKKTFLVAAVVGALSFTAVPEHYAKSLGWQADELGGTLARLEKLPKIPEGTETLRFGDFYKKPVGKYGLEYSERVQALAGKRVRILGFMVRQEKPVPGLILLAPYSMTTNEAEYGLCDDFPPEILFVHLPEGRLAGMGREKLDVPFASPLFAETGHEHCHSGHEGEDARKLAAPWIPGPLLLTGTLETGRREEADGRVSHVRLVIAQDAVASDALRVAPARAPEGEPKTISTPHAHSHGECGTPGNEKKQPTTQNSK
ncbi:MAG: DUF3299 domain-containing protein [Puniceicoccales bacterium]|jgi:hypothetical protein|nr:DUF3299 domain-containing protein [Puniceicoccales bacterium]